MGDNDVIGEGGFGCVFRKPLKCKNRTLKKIPSGNVTKLLLKRHALTEYNTSMRIYDIVKTIPNHSRYFILHDMSICDPYQIPQKLKETMKKCKYLLKKDDVDTFNKRILNGEFLQLNIPYGGKSMVELWERMIFSKFRSNKELHRDFSSAIDGVVVLLEKAVIPMNSMGVYHNDIKSDNVLYAYNKKRNEYEYRIIDWGLSAVTDDSSKIIDISNRSFQWNAPLIAPLMLDGMYSNIQEIAELCKGKNSSEVSVIMETHMVNISGHLDYIEDKLLPIIGKGNMSDKTIGDILSNNVDEYIYRYGTNNRDKDDFVTDVLSHNIDVIGIISIFIGLLVKNYDSGPANRSHPIFKYLKKILWKYMYSPEYVAVRIPISTLIKDLNKMKYM